MEDPDYGEALFRKCEIYEDMCEYTMCLNMAEWLIQKLSDDEDQQYICEQLELLIEEVTAKLDNEASDKIDYEK